MCPRRFLYVAGARALWNFYLLPGMDRSGVSGFGRRVSVVVSMSGMFGRSWSSWMVFGLVPSIGVVLSVVFSS